MLLVLGAGIALLVCGLIAELLCRVPPQDPEEGQDLEAGDQPA